MNNKILTINADHVSAIDCGLFDILVIINPSSKSQLKIGSTFEQIHLYDHNEMFPMIKNGNCMVVKIDDEPSLYAQDDVVNHVVHIILARL